MILKGTVQDGLIRIDVHGLLPDGTTVVVTPVQENNKIQVTKSTEELEKLKEELLRIARLPCENPNEDGFTVADIDKLLYGSN